MPLILGIETATQVCSVSLSQDEETLSLRQSHEKNAHSKNINIFIEQVVKESRKTIRNIDAVSVSKGPGSYTGLRIGVSTAKGLCYAMDKPLIAVSTLQAMACGLSEKLKVNKTYNKDVLLCPMIDARRMEVYTAIFDTENKQLRDIKAEIIDKNSFSKYLKDHKIYFFGDGSNKCQEVLGNNPNAIFIDDFKPSAKYIAGLAFKKYQKKQFEDLAYFEPFYLKDFIAGKPKVKGLK